MSLYPRILFGNPCVCYLDKKQGPSEHNRYGIEWFGVFLGIFIFTKKGVN